jgi:apolipoprotein D and lipocalin family protein
MKKILPLILVLFVTSCSSQMKPLETVPNVDLERYTGKWFEIARLPNSFEKGLICVTAEYSLRENGKINVLNAGRKESDPSKEKTAKGRAKVPDAKEPGRLKVTFFWPFYGDYYIFHLDEENYQYALVGDPSRKYMWVLSRSPFMDDELYAKLLDIAREKDFAVEELLKVSQECWR